MNDKQKDYFREIDCSIENIIEKNINNNFRYIDIDFDNDFHQGLFNKIIYLSGVVRYCLKNDNIRLVEPTYKIGINHHTRAEKGILFSEIFDIDFFNKKMENLFYMVPLDLALSNNLKIESLPHKYANIYGWNIEHDEYINKATDMNKISKEDNILLKVLNALKLNKKNREILYQELEKLGYLYNSIHIRNETDWPGEWNKITNNEIVNLYKNSNIYDNSKTLFFSIGESHDEIKELFNNINIVNFTYNNNNLLYDLKSAISYTICLFSNTFISHTYSTFSSLITMQRELSYNNFNNYSYNKESIYKRVDRGLNYKKSIETNKDASTFVEIVDSITTSELSLDKEINKNYNTSCIITMVKNENDFLNPWIEHHLKIGFNHFYILVDNIYEKQSEYIIEEQFKKHVSLIYAEEKDVADYLGNSIEEILKTYHHFSYITHNLINHKIIYKNIIKEDWCTAIGVDQFIYLNGNTIQDYLSSINESCTQIIVPWSFCCLNTNNSNFDNLFENYHLYCCKYAKTNGHSNALIRTKNMHSMHYTSHSFISKSLTQKVFILDEYFELNNLLCIKTIFSIAQKKLETTTFDNLKISSFHFILRNINELFVKKIFSWENFNNEYLINFFNILSLDIKNNTKNCLINYNLTHRLNAFICSENYFSEKNFDLNIPILETKNSSEHYDNLLLKELNKYDVTIEEFDIWKKTLFVLG